MCAAGHTCATVSGTVNCVYFSPISFFFFVLLLTSPTTNKLRAVILLRGLSQRHLHATITRLPAPTGTALAGTPPSLIISSLTTISDISKQLRHAQPTLLPINLYLGHRCLTEDFLHQQLQSRYDQREPAGPSYDNPGNKQLHEYRGGELDRAQ